MPPASSVVSVFPWIRTSFQPLVVEESLRLNAMPEEVEGCSAPFQKPRTLWMLSLVMWMPLRIPLVSFSSWMPLRIAAEVVVLVISRFSIVQYCWLSR